MCLHSPLDLHRDANTLCITDLETFDTCNYVYSLKNVDIDDLVIIQLNICGICSKTSLLTHLLNSCVDGRVPDIVLLSETWLTPNSPNMTIPGFEFIHCDRTHKRGGGVGILISEKLRYTICKTISSSIVENECITIELELRSHDKCIISSMYRPPNVDVDSFQSCYNSLLCEMSKKKPKAIVIGLDHNLDFLKCDTHRGTSQFIQHNLDFNLIPTITRPTRITRNSATLIDNIIVSQSLCGSYLSSVMIDDISDHMPTACVIKALKRAKKDPVAITSSDTRPRNMTALKNHLQSYEWKTILAEQDVNCCMSSFHNMLTSEMELCIPMVTRTINPKRIRREPWLTASLSKCIEKNKKNYCRALRNNNNPNIRTHYLAYNKILRKSLKLAKQEFHREKCREFQHNTKKLWRLINKISGRINDKSSTIDCITIDGVKQYQGSIIANSLASYFANVGQKFAEKIPKSNISVKSYLEALQNNTQTLFFNPCSVEEVCSLVRELPAKRSSGFDDVSNILLKELIPYLCEPLCILINRSLENGIFPDLMKLAEVVPLYKGKAHDQETNYRPISLLTTMSKVMEKVVYKRVYEFLTRTGQICDTQYGFRSKHSCEHAIAQLVGTVLKNLENKRTTISVMLDLSKAFDTIEHSIMIQKLELYGVRGVCFEWFKSYLEQRQLRVKCRVTSTQEEAVSDNYIVNYGTPQGSCLGPLIFLIFVNDMHLHLTDVDSVQFADDTTIIFSHKNVNYLKYCVERELAVLNDWFKANKLTLNIDKSVYMVFDRTGRKDLKELVLGDKSIKQVKETKFLGTWLDDQLNWKAHMTRLLTKLKCGLGMLQRSKNFLTTRAMKLLYYGQIHSHLCYAVSVWGPMLSKGQLNTLKGIQNKCLKLINSTYSTRERHLRLKILSIEKLIDLEQSKLGYKLCHQLLPVVLTRLLKSDQNNQDMEKLHSYSTRQKAIPHRPSAKLGLYRNSFLYRSISTYSNLPLELQQLPNLNIFNNRVKAHLLALKQ